MSSSSPRPNTFHLRREALAIKNDTEGGKYIVGLKEVRIQSASEGIKILRLGQANRRVFGTLANEVSSRSHAIFTIKVMRTLKHSKPVDLSNIIWF